MCDLCLTCEANMQYMRSSPHILFFSVLITCTVPQNSAKIQIDEC